ncbi:ImmA/IrrE family metallo-endopeptidase [Caballeronia sp. RCC_10]|uniref:ImmA/IrrE family metallo-endopeptidase n=1 Tax=Caballeronia sp. RCC_10 TaxID=3239227 RepID=UPI003524BC26
MAADQAVAADAISPADARHLVTIVMDQFRPAVGRYVIQTFDDLPRETSKVTVKTPIAIVVGDSRIGPVPGIYSNCRADSSTRTIRCDLRLLDDLIDDLDAYARVYSETQRAKVREHILQLVLAHELGHIVHGDKSAAYHGTENGFSVFHYLQYKIELRADEFAVQLIDRYVKPQERDLEYGTIVDLASGAVRKSLCPKTFPAPCPCPGYTNAASCSRVPLGPGLVIADNDQIPVTLSGTHPVYVVRFARLLYLSRDPKAHGFYSKEAKQVLLRVVVLNEQGQPESAAAVFK